MTGSVSSHTLPPVLKFGAQVGKALGVAIRRDVRQTRDEVGIDCRRADVQLGSQHAAPLMARNAWPWQHSVCATGLTSAADAPLAHRPPSAQFRCDCPGSSGRAKLRLIWCYTGHAAYQAGRSSRTHPRRSSATTQVGPVARPTLGGCS